MFLHLFFLSPQLHFTPQNAYHKLSNLSEIIHCLFLTSAVSSREITYVVIHKELHEPKIQQISLLFVISPHTIKTYFI